MPVDPAWVEEKTGYKLKAQGASTKEGAGCGIANRAEEGRPARMPEELREALRRWADSLPETAPDPEVFFEPREGNQEDLLELVDDPVRKAIEALPDDFRNAVIMADLEDISYKEIADIMQCPLGTVMSRLYRGRKLLREALEDYARERRMVPGARD